jgi:hypothetical protein
MGLQGMINFMMKSAILTLPKLPRPIRYAHHRPQNQLDRPNHLRSGERQDIIAEL